MRTLQSSKDKSAKALRNPAGPASKNNALSASLAIIWLPKTPAQRLHAASPTASSAPEAQTASSAGLDPTSATESAPPTNVEFLRTAPFAITSTNATPATWDTPYRTEYARSALDFGYDSSILIALFSQNSFEVRKKQLV